MTLCMPMEFFYENILEHITTKKTFNSIKKKYDEMGVDIMECEIVDDYTDDEKKQIENKNDWEGYVKFEFDEDLVINKFDYFTTYNTSSPFAMELCYIMPDDDSESEEEDDEIYCKNPNLCPYNSYVDADYFEGNPKTFICKKCE